MNAPAPPPAAPGDALDLEPEHAWQRGLVTAFILFHLAHLTFPGLAVGAYVHSHTNVYGNFVGSFQNPIVVVFYVVAQIFLGLHLYHGGWSLLQTLGLSHPRHDDKVRLLPKAIGIGVAVGPARPAIASDTAVW